MKVTPAHTDPLKSALLFDEHSMSRHGAAAALAQANPAWNVVTASRLSEFLRHTDGGIWNLLLLDLPTLGADAEDLLRVFRRSCPGSIIVMLNGPEDDAARERFFAAGADGYLSKSAAPEELPALAASLLAAPASGSAAAWPRARPAGRMSVILPLHQERPDLPALLTDRQTVVLSLMAEGRSTKDIARRLGLAVGTVKAHLSGTYRALGAHSRVEALAKAGMVESLGRQLA
jgi:DNA-binding NarL/FixJ family response regulator